MKFQKGDIIVLTSDDQEHWSWKTSYSRYTRGQRVRVINVLGGAFDEKQNGYALQNVNTGDISHEYVGFTEDAFRLCPKILAKKALGL